MKATMVHSKQKTDVTLTANIEREAVKEVKLRQL